MHGINDCRRELPRVECGLRTPSSTPGHNCLQPRSKATDQEGLTPAEGPGSSVGGGGGQGGVEFSHVEWITLNTNRLLVKMGL